MVHSVQAGYTEKALSYADKALQLLQQQRGRPIEMKVCIYMYVTNTHVHTHTHT